MNGALPRIARIAIFLGVLATSFVIGLSVAGVVERLFESNHTGAFAALVGMAALSLFLGYKLERPMVWKDLFESKADELRWIGSNSPQVIGSAPPPISLGLALALLLRLLA
jgi:hypothetical protein